MFFFIFFVLCFGLLGCVSGLEEYVWNCEVISVFVVDDGQLYLLLCFDELMCFNVVLFCEYWVLMDSLLCEVVVCVQMYFYEDWCDLVNKVKVYGSYVLLLWLEQVMVEQVVQFKLEWIEVFLCEVRVVEEWVCYYLLMDWICYVLVFDCVCNFLWKGGSYYSVLFEGDGEQVQLLEVVVLVEKGKLVQLINVWVQWILLEREDKLGVGLVVGKVLGVVLIFVVVLVFVLSLLFLGLDYWK